MKKNKNIESVKKMKSKKKIKKWKSEGVSAKRKFKKGKSGKIKYIPGQFLEKVDWSTVDLTKIQKNFYKPSAKTQARSGKDVEKYRETNKITVVGSAPPPVLDFREANFDSHILAKLDSLGYEKPTPIQAQGWPIALSGQNLVGIAETGAGKTLAFLLPALVHIAHQKSLKSGEGPIALMLAPTRELVQQIQGVADQFNVKAVAVYGGSSKEKQVEFLKTGAEIVVATPGRLLDLLQVGATNLKRTTFLVLDEADRMLDMGFEDQLRKILNQIRPDRQLLMWSATWPDSVRKLAEDFLGEYVQIFVGNTDLSANHNIRQIVQVCHDFEKQDKLVGLLKKLKSAGGLKTFIFANTKRQVDFICRLLKRNEFTVGAIHGDKTQAKRNSILKRFSEGVVEILVATDVAARGLDVSDVKHVINYDFPLNTEDYVHRIGRTGRQQKKGTAYTFFGQKNYKQAESLISILEEAKQTVDSELRSLTSLDGKSIDSSCEERFGSRSFFSVGD